jgi:phosphatidylinositol-3-phosphatase
VATTKDDQKGGGSSSCAECGAAFSGEQRYCLECGARRGDLPPAIAARISTLLRRDRAAGERPVKPAPKQDEAEQEDKEKKATNYMPSPRAAAVAVLGMLGLGVLLGSVTDQIAQSAGFSTILLEMPAEAPAAVDEEPEEEAAAPEAASAEAASAPLAKVPLPEAPIEEPLPEAEPPLELPPELPEEEGLPEVKHAFLLVLGDNGYEETFGKASPLPYLSKKLPKQGELLTNYYAVTQGSLANQIALLSGQGPTPETAADCPTYADITPATTSLEGQVEGSGCVYPSTTQTIAGQLVAAKLKWRAYVEGIGGGLEAGEAPTCRHPALGSADPNREAAPGDPYLTWRNPFVYFHSILDSPECGEDDADLTQLTTDLKSAKTTPTLSYIVPNACHAGGEVACEPGQPTGAAAVQPFLEEVLPKIVESAAYKEGGLIMITSAQAPQSGEKADPSSCCISPIYPNLPPPAAEEPATGPVKPTGGGGQVGMLLISPFVEAGSVNETTYANHFSLLLTLEELFGLEKLGYANEVALLPFDSSVFNAAATE